LIAAIRSAAGFTPLSLWCLTGGNTAYSRLDSHAKKESGVKPAALQILAAIAARLLSLRPEMKLFETKTLL